MKTILIMALLCLVTFPTIASDDNLKPLKIAVVDIQQLMSKSKAAQSIQKQGKDLRAKYQKQVKKIEKGLKASEKKVIDASKAKDKEAFIKNRKKFQEELADSQKELAKLNSKLDKAIGSALNKLRDEIVEIVGNIATDNKYDMVISRANIIIVSKKIDITADVMKKLNKNLSSVKVKG